MLFKWCNVEKEAVASLETENTFLFQKNQQEVMARKDRMSWKKCAAFLLLTVVSLLVRSCLCSI